MSDDREGSAARYAGELEALWAARVGRAVVLSPRDWATALGWYEARVPLALVREAMDDALARRPRTAPERTLRSLARLAPAVDRAWRAIREGRVRSGPLPAPEAPVRAAELWRRRAAAEPPDSRLAHLLGLLVARLDAGETRDHLDDVLDRELAGAVEPALRAEVVRTLERELEPFRGRLAPQVLATSVERATVERLRERLELPRFGEDPGAERAPAASEPGSR